MSESRSEPDEAATPVEIDVEDPSAADVVAIPKPSGETIFGHLVDGRAVPDQPDDRI